METESAIGAYRESGAVVAVKQGPLPEAQTRIESAIDRLDQILDRARGDLKMLSVPRESNNPPTAIDEDMTSELTNAARGQARRLNRIADDFVTLLDSLDI